MSYLEQLKQQATEVEAQKKSEGKTAAQLTEAYDKEVRPRLKKSFQYFYEVTQQLAMIKPKTAVNYELPGVGALLNLYQDEYILGSYQKKDDSFFVRMFCHSNLKQRFEVKSILKMEEYKDYLWKHNIKFKYRQVNDMRSQFLRAVFEIQGEVIAEMSFKGHYDSSGIEIHVQNLPDLGKETYLCPATKFDDNFLDKLAMYITRSHPENILKAYKIGQSWAKKVDYNKQLQREQILAKLQKAKSQEQNLKIQAALKSKAKQKQVVDQKETEKKSEKSSFFANLFGKK